MKDEIFKVTERRLWNQAVHEGILEKSAAEDTCKIRQALNAVAKDVKRPKDLVLAVAEVLSYAVAEIELMFRVTSAVHRKAWMRLLEHLPAGSREKIEHEIRTLDLKDVVL